MNELNSFIMKLLQIYEDQASPCIGNDRSFSRERLHEIFNKFGYKYGVEIGVKKGHFSLNLCRNMPNLKMICIDPYAPSDEHRTTQGRQNYYFEEAQKNLKNFNVTFIRKTSMDAVEDFNNNEFDFVYIDAMHDFDNVMKDIICWTPKVRKWGIVSGHDYMEWPRFGVIEAIRAYTYAHCIYPLYLTYDGYYRNKSIHSWFFIKSWS